MSKDFLGHCGNCNVTLTESVDYLPLQTTIGTSVFCSFCCLQQVLPRLKDTELVWKTITESRILIWRDESGMVYCMGCGEKEYDAWQAMEKNSEVRGLRKQALHFKSIMDREFARNNPHLLAGKGGKFVVSKRWKQAEEEFEALNAQADTLVCQKSPFLSKLGLHVHSGFWHSSADQGIWFCSRECLQNHDPKSEHRVQPPCSVEIK